MHLNGRASCSMSDEEENTHVTFGGGSEVRKRGQPRWSRLEMLLAALCVLLATVSVVLVVLVAAQNIHKGHDSTDGAVSHHYSSSQERRPTGQGQDPYTVVPGVGTKEAGLDVALPPGTNPALSTPQEGVCLTPGCVKAAAQLLSAMNQEADACEDFFEFACGTWNRMHLIPDDMSHVDNFVTLNDNVQTMLKDLLEADVNSADLEATKKAQHLYASCINETAADQDGLEPVKRLLEELGGWPVVAGISWTPPSSLSSFWVADGQTQGRGRGQEDSSSSSSRGSSSRGGSGNGSHLLNLLAALRRLNSAALVSMSVGPDERHSHKYIIQLDQPDLGMPSPDYYLKGQESGNFLKVYENYTRELAVMLGASPRTALQDMHDLLELEIRLANITIPKAQRRDVEKLYNRMTLRQLQRAIPGFDWLGYVQIVMGSVGTEVKDTEEVVVYAPEYFRKMADIYTSTSERTLVNYLIWRILMDLVDHLPRQYRAVKKDYHKAIFGTERERSRWRDCVKYVSSMDIMGDAAGRLFVEKHFNQHSKQTAVDMIHNIREAFQELVEEADWMDEPTKVVAREKAQAVSEQVGYTDSILNNTSLNLKYADVSFTRNRFFDNVLISSKHTARATLSKLRQSVDRSQWLTTPTVVNAFYIATRNTMTIPAAILQPPFYNKEYPKSLNYGGIGMVIGHEITHGFDDRGRQYDKVGNLVQWWDDVVIQRFKDRAQCIIDQYSNFSLPEVDMQVNGIQTQGENIADNGGIKEAYRAYRKWVSAQGREEPRLPGMLQYTHDQLFFINFAQVWCGTMRPEATVKKLRTGPHSPARFRVIGTLQNQDFFSQAFHCHPSSYMNPAHKCSIW